ncbi:hypothetical protein AAKU52_002589 [Pedobacter sp. CG_S7]|uniref:hypothetical protein n=1 Tax=Pedobacter sp. CG_S7 TaxID=3143930 RepID=UPI00339488E2
MKNDQPMKSDNLNNDNPSAKKIKNLLIKADEEVINEFKIIAFDYYKNTKQLSLFSFRHFLALVLSNLETDFKAKYGSIEEPTEDFIKFYQKRGNKASIESRDIKVMGNISFLFPINYADLYYRIMHTYYINEISHVSSYSISQFFYFIVDYIKPADLKSCEIHI